MKIEEYNPGDNVQVLINNPRNNNKEEWKDGVVLYKRMIYPKMNYEKFTPYPILIVSVMRTYCKATPIYRWINDNIPVFVDNSLEYYDKISEEGFIYENQIKLKI